VDLGGRGVAVAEPGAELSWAVGAGGRASIHQDAGDVFYRVEAGPAFEVTTPAGTARVLGTCFRMEVMEMRLSRDSVGGAAVGAAVVAAVLVTVYEGRVAVANGEGDATIEAGERAWLRAGAPPQEAGDGRADEAPVGPFADAPSVAATADELREVNAALRAAGLAQGRRIAELEATVAELSGRAPTGDTGTDLDERWFPVSDDELRALVDECTLRLDQPPIDGIEPGDVERRSDELGLGPGELEVLRAAVAQLHESYRSRLRPLYVEATGDAIGAASLSPRAMLAEIRDKSPRAATGGAMMRVVRERAGLEAPPDDLAALPPYERALRLFAGLGDELEALLADELGEPRAFELRAAAGGWPWSRSQFSGCGRR
jgi:hypothetical protein